MSAAEKERPCEVEFYWIKQKAAGPPVNGKPGKAAKIDIAFIEETLLQLEATENNECFLPHNKETLRLNCIKGSTKPGFVLHISRKKSPPIASNRKGIKPLQKDADADYGEYCHLMFFQPHYVAAIRHQHSPSLIDLTVMLINKANGLGHLSFEVIVSSNYWDKFNLLNSVSNMHMTVTKSNIAKLHSITGSQAQVIKTLLEETEFERISFKFGMTKGRHNKYSNWAKNFIRNLLLSPEAKKEFKELEIKLSGDRGKDITRKFIDLFNSKIIADANVKLSDGTLLDNESAFTEIMKAFDNNRVLLQESISIGNVDE